MVQSVYKLGFLFYLFQIYIQVTVCWGFILFLQFLNLPLGDCRLGGYRLFIRLRTYFQGSKSGVQSVYKVSEPTSWKIRLCRAFVYPFQTYPQGDCRQGVQPECICSEPTSRGPLYPVLQFSNLPPGDCQLGGIDCL